MARPDSYETPPGTAVHPWINKPDIKFNANGVFKTGLLLYKSEPEVQRLMAIVTEAADKAFAELTKDLTAAERRKWKPYIPFEDEADDTTGEPTGRVKFNFKRNFKVKIDGEDKELKVSVYDSHGGDIPGDELPAIFNGSTLKVAFTMRPIKVPGQHVAGVKLDFFGVMIVKLAEGRGRSPFAKSAGEPDETEGSGYVFKSHAATQAAGPGGAAEEPGADY